MIIIYDKNQGMNKMWMMFKVLAIRNIIFWVDTYDCQHKFSCFAVNFIEKKLFVW